MPGEWTDPAEATDDLSPEWTAYEARWAVRVSDFESPLEASRFVVKRKAIFRTAQGFGIDPNMLSAFEPDRPGFEDRLGDALEKLAEVAHNGLAAE